jgi:hypothetical protein
MARHMLHSDDADRPRLGFAIQVEWIDAPALALVCDRGRSEVGNGSQTETLVFWRGTEEAMHVPSITDERSSMPSRNIVLVASPMARGRECYPGWIHERTIAGLDRILAREPVKHLKEFEACDAMVRRHPIGVDHRP